MSLCDKCISGVRHEGTPEGKEETIGGVRVYVATPTGDYPKDKAILFLPDIFGIDLENCKLLADDFARNGLKVYAIDYFGGDAAPADALSTPGFDIPAWFGKHGAGVTRPYIDNVVAALKEQGVTQFGATGYCLGARYTFDIAYDKVIKVAVVAHPSLLKIPEDLERIGKTEIPLLINSCETDSQFPPEAQKQADDILGGGLQTSRLYRREYFPKCMHGFAVRANLSEPAEAAGKEGAFKASVEFFKQHL